MGEIAEMMLDGTMDCETGEWNFDGEDGPGWPMTGKEARRFRRLCGQRSRADATRESPVYQITKGWRKKIEAFGTLQNNDAYHWQLRQEGKVVADWWPHKRKWRLAGKQTVVGHESELVKALRKAAGQ